jgi:hypothetical protein
MKLNKENLKKRIMFKKFISQLNKNKEHLSL